MKKSSSHILLAMTLLFSTRAFSVPILNSYPGAVATIYLDFDGQTVNSSVWNGGSPIFCAASGMTDPQITEAFYRVAEDYRPFEINITTDSTVFLAAPLTKRIRVIITPTNGWCPGVGGISCVGSFTWGDDTPCFVFCNTLGPNSPKMVGECCSHESGHTVGLSHQSKYGNDCTTPIETYSTGQGVGEVGWSPIMGNSYYRNFSNWNNGPTPIDCTNTQDNLSIISTQNGFGYRADDYGEAMNSGTYTLPASNFSVTGIITTNTDKDAFRFILARNSTVHLAAVPFNVSSNWIGADLDIQLSLYNSSGTLIRIYNPPTTLDLTVDTTLLAGTYYLLIEGGGNANISSYGSLGEYTISGSSSILPIHAVNLSGTVDKNKHNLRWNIIADEPIKTLILETSTDGSIFRELTSVSPQAVAFSYDPFQSSTLYYRLKVTSVIDQTIYSNILVLRGDSKNGKPFFVSTLVRDEILVNASENYQYQLSDMNGRFINYGRGLIGINKINIGNQPDGMYIIRLLGNNDQQTERIIRQ